MTNRRVETAATRLFGDQADPVADDIDTGGGAVPASAPVETAASPRDALPVRRQRWLKRAVHQQGLLQIYEDFCLRDDSDCERCTFPERVQCFRAR